MGNITDVTDALAPPPLLYFLTAAPCQLLVNFNAVSLRDLTLRVCLSLCTDVVSASAATTPTLAASAAAGQ